jgi:hypothetical protein
MLKNDAGSPGRNYIPSKPLWNQYLRCVVRSEPWGRAAVRSFKKETGITVSRVL